MLNRQSITIYNNIKDSVTKLEDYIKVVIPNVYVDEQKGVNLKDYGTLDVYNIYLSIPYSENYLNIKEYKQLSNLEKQKFFTLEPKKTYIVLKESDINYSDYETKSEFLDAITSERSCLVQTVDERYHGSKPRWHIEVGAV